MFEIIVLIFVALITYVLIRLSICLPCFSKKTPKVVRGKLRTMIIFGSGLNTFHCKSFTINVIFKVVILLRCCCL
jgi:energy-converting hydrogenase Eha subunit A